jgi:hypothetical protein
MTGSIDSELSSSSLVDAKGLVLSTALRSFVTEGLWAVDKTAPPWEYGARSGSISHAIRCDFPCICGRNHTQDSQVEASDEILGTHRVGPRST